MTQAIASGLGYLCRGGSECLKGVGSWVVNGGHKAVTLVSTSAQQAGSFLYRIGSSAYKAIASLISYLFVHKQNSPSVATNVTTIQNLPIEQSQITELFREEMHTLLSHESVKSYIPQNASYTIIDMHRAYSSKLGPSYYVHVLFEFEKETGGHKSVQGNIVVFSLKATPEDNGQSVRYSTIPLYSVNANRTVYPDHFSSVIDSHVVSLNVQKEEITDCRIELDPAAPGINQIWTITTIHGYKYSCKVELDNTSFKVRAVSDFKKLFLDFTKLSP